MNILFVCSRLDTMVSKRELLIQSLIEGGNKVSLISMERDLETEKKLEQMGVDYKYFDGVRNKISILSDIRFFLCLVILLRRGEYDRVVSYTIKPNVYSGMACYFSKNALSFFPFVTGLGYAFQGGGVARRLLRVLTVFLHRLSFRNAEKAVFQNKDNESLFVEAGIVNQNDAVLIMGDGVDVAPIGRPYELRERGGFVCVARLLGEKGLRELHAACIQVKQFYPDFHIDLYGPLESSPDAISEEEVEQWAKSHTIVWQGYSNNIKQVLEGASCFVLPSYHEGMSTAVAESMAAGVPIIGTDISGIRELVQNNGFLVEPKDSENLANAILKFIELNIFERKKMSEAGVKMAAQLCDREVIMNRISKLVLEKQ